MTKRLDPEIKAMRAIGRVLSGMGAREQKRILEFFVSRFLRVPWFSIGGD